MAVIENYDMYDVQKNGTITSYKVKQNGRILKPQKASQSKKGYFQVRLYNPTTPKGKLHYIHHLVWETFVGDIPKGLEIDHRDRNTSNNSLENLQLLTRKENLEKYFLEDFGRIIRDHRDEIIKDYLELGSFPKVAEKWGVGYITIFRVIKNKVSAKIKGKSTTRDLDNGISDDFTNLDLRNKDVRERLGLPPIKKRTKTK